MKATFFTAIFTIFFSCMALAGSIEFSPSWVIFTNSGRSLEVTTLTTGKNAQHENVLMYTTVNGTQGYLKESQIANRKELIAAIKGAIEGRAALRKKMTPPAPNKFAREGGALGQAAGGSSTGPGGAEILQHCAEMWGDDYSMVEYCAKKQMTARENVNRIGGPIVESCKDEWLPDYTMVEYCVNKQTAARERLDKY